MTDVWRFYERFVTQWDRDRARGRRDFMERRYLDELTSRLRNGSCCPPRISLYPPR